MGGEGQQAAGSGHAVCPSCGGRGGNPVFVNRGPDIRTHSIEHADCSVCKGAGSITIEQFQRLAAGRALRASRVAQGKTLLAASREMGCTPAELSCLEITGEPVSEQRIRKASERRWS